MPNPRPGRRQAGLEVVAYGASTPREAESAPHQAGHEAVISKETPKPQEAGPEASAPTRWT